MKNIFYLFILTMILSLLPATTANGIIPGREQQGYDNGSGSLNNGMQKCPFGMKEEASAGRISREEMERLVYLREEEKLARDVYLSLYDRWGLIPFKNISKSEQIHTNAVKSLLEKYAMDDPVSQDTPGSFTNNELQDLYTTLIARGEKSEVEALKVGALIEEKDIFDIQEALDKDIESDDIRLVLENLKRGSSNHLRAFVRNLKIRNIDYTPVILMHDHYNSIINR